MSAIPYQKLSGAGNTFVVLDRRDVGPDVDLAGLARTACRDDLEHGGADGLIVVGDAEGNDFEMKYYNRDGSTGMMCGNGARCAVLFAADHGYVRNRDDISFTNAGTAYRASLTEAGARVSFPDPKLFRLNLTLDVLGKSIPCHYGDVGTPHVIVFVADLGDPASVHADDVDMGLWGPALRNHPAFAPEGANANVVEVLPEGGGIRLRTFERGVEAETGACGTGAIASAVITAMLRGMPVPVTVVPTSNSPLRVDFRFVGPDHVTDVSLEGGAVVLMEGMLDSESISMHS